MVRTQSRRFFFALLLSVAILLAIVVQPLASALFLAIVLTAVLWPVQQRLAKWLRSRGIAAAIVVMSVLLAVLGPVVALSAVIITEASNGVAFITQTVQSEGAAGLIRRLPASVRDFASNSLARFSSDPNASQDEQLQEQVKAQTGKAAKVVGGVVSATSSFVFQMAMMLIALYFLLVDGTDMVHWLDGVVPLRKGQTHAILSDFRRVSYSVIVSSLLTTGVQALAALVGYLIVSVPYPLFFAGLTFMVGLVPAIGAGAVCLVAAALLWFNGHPYNALFLAIWGIVVVGLIDNVIKPWIAKAGMEMHGAVVFFALIGGIAAFGMIGLLVGPLAVSLFLTLLRMYQREYREATVKAS